MLVFSDVLYWIRVGWGRKVGLWLFLSLSGGIAEDCLASAIVVGHDVNTLATHPTAASGQESLFAVNVATFLTTGSATKNLLLFESNPGNRFRNYSSRVITALENAGFDVTVTSDYTTDLLGFDAIFAAQNFQLPSFLDNNSLIDYVEDGGSVYLAGGAGIIASDEALGWNTFLNHYGLGFDDVGYNGLNSVTISGSHSIFDGITSLGSGNGQTIVDLGTNPNAQILQFSGSQGVYAVVNVPRQFQTANNSNLVPLIVPEPTAAVIFGVGMIACVVLYRRVPNSARQGCGRMPR